MMNFWPAWDEGRIDTDFLERRDLEEDLVSTERAPTDIERFENRNLDYIDDVLESLSWTNTVRNVNAELNSYLLDAERSPNEQVRVQLRFDIAYGVCPRQRLEHVVY